ncbi:hypothetical protein ABES25_09710 [Bacillus gobiensis]|uniref:endolytic transglycosylase MltG n=1 Tax=Bacillus gobiensis TaxID=1441095 RepID=UPI003D1D8B57
MTKRGLQAFAGGMILATSVLAGTFYFSPDEKADASKDEAEITENQVKSYLEANKLVSLKRNDYEKLLTSKEEALKQADEAEQEKPAEKETSKKEGNYKLTIQDGMSSADVSNQLEKDGLIPSARDFNDYVIDGGYHTKVRAGDFELKYGMGFKQIVNVLTR